MSETESFESVMDFANTVVAYCDIPLLDRLQAAHDREIAQAQRSTDTKHKEVATRLYNMRFHGGRFGQELSHALEGCEANEDTDTITGSYSKVLDNFDRLREAYDRDMQDARECMDKLGYHRGYIDGQHSMDAEHRAVAMRLRALPLDGGSHENLSQIARAVYHADFGWTQGACAALRDELVRLMGGVSDDTCDSQCCGACADSDGGSHREQVEVNDGGTADDCAAHPRGGAGSELVHMDGLTTYDVLWNERRKAVCELRKMRSCKEDHFAPELFFDGLYDALGCRAETGGDSGDQMCDRLIHLLGGDQPSGIDVLRAMDDRKTESGITDELREYIAVTWDDSPYAKQIPMELRAIADRIDERAKHDRESDQLRIEKLVRQRDEAREERDELQSKLDTCYRRKGAEDVVRGIALGTYSMTEGIEKLERIYGGD